MKKSLLIFFLAAGMVSYAQNDTLTLDRPSVTQTPHTVTKGNLQLQFGFEKHNLYKPNYWLAVPNTLVRFGFGRKWELRLETTYRSEYIYLVPEPLKIEGFDPLKIGTKIILGEEKGWIPKTAFIGTIGLSDVASEVFEPRETIASLIFAMENSLSSDIFLGYNLGLKWEGQSSSPVFTYTFAPQFDITDRLQFYVESYGYIGKENFHNHNIDGGIIFLVNKNIKVDVSGGAGLSKASERNFVGLGLSFRIPVSAKQ